jgi:hypothetical protein
MPERSAALWLVPNHRTEGPSRELDVTDVTDVNRARGPFADRSGDQGTRVSNYSAPHTTHPPVASNRSPHTTAHSAPAQVNPLTGMKRSAGGSSTGASSTARSCRSTPTSSPPSKNE